METIIFFDIDNTIYNNKKGLIPPNTKRLLEELAKKDNVELGIATGRGLKKLDVIEEVLPFFKYLVLVNGGVGLNNNDVIFSHPIIKKDLVKAIKLANKNDLTVGLVSLDDDAVNRWDEKVEKGMLTLRGKAPKVDKDFYKKKAVYQIWLFSELEDLTFLTKKMPKFKIYPWHFGGADFTYKSNNKYTGIKKLLENKSDYKLVCVGDGANDILMIENADIGIAMENSRFLELKSKATYIAPNINEDKLYDLFKKLNLV